MSLITPKCAEQMLGGFDVEIFCLLVLAGLESMKVRSGLILVDVIPLRTKDLLAKKGAINTVLHQDS